MGRCTDDLFLSTIWYESTVFCGSCHGGSKYIYGHLSAHNALHDAVFTAHICQNLDIQQGILHYDLIQRKAVILSYIHQF